MPRDLSARDVLLLDELGLLPRPILTGWEFGGYSTIGRAKALVERAGKWAVLAIISGGAAAAFLIIGLSFAIMGPDTRFSWLCLALSTALGACAALALWRYAVAEAQFSRPGEFGYEYPRLLDELQLTHFEAAAMRPEDFGVRAQKRHAEATAAMRRLDDAVAGYSDLEVSTDVLNARSTHGQMTRRLDRFGLKADYFSLPEAAASAPASEPAPQPT